MCNRVRFDIENHSHHYLTNFHHHKAPMCYPKDHHHIQDWDSYNLIGRLKNLENTWCMKLSCNQHIEFHKRSTIDRFLLMKENFQLDMKGKLTHRKLNIVDCKIGKWCKILKYLKSIHSSTTNKIWGHMLHIRHCNLGM